MKKIFMLVAMFTMMTSNIEAANINELTIKDGVEPIVNVISANAPETPFYSLNITKEKTMTMKKYLKLNDEQTDLLLNLHNTINREFDKLNKIEDKVLREKMFNNLIAYWRRNANICILLAEEANQTYTTYDVYRMRNQYRFYWACVNATLRKRGIITEFGDFNINGNDTIVSK